MKKNTSVVVKGYKNTKKNDRIAIRNKLILITIFSIILVIFSNFVYSTQKTSENFAKEVEEFSKLNSKTVFSVDEILLYSSGFVKRNEDNRILWNVDIGQFTDISIKLNNNESTDGITLENTIKELYIDNIQFNSNSQTEKNMYYKSPINFGKFDGNEENKINNRLDFKVSKNGEIDIAYPVLYSNLSVPINLSYSNTILKNELISDISSEITFDGSILKKTNIYLDDIKCVLSFNINIINNYGQKFIGKVYIDIPIIDTINNTSVYDGKIEKKIESKNIVKFLRIK